MSRQEFIDLIEENGLIMERLFSRIHQYPSQIVGYSRQQLMILLDLMVSGRSKLKEIARRQGMPTPNLCIMFRRLEAEGLVSREIDDTDRRNTWYSLTPNGHKITVKFKNAVLDTISSFCSGLTPGEEQKLTECLGHINQILKRVEEQNA